MSPLTEACGTELMSEEEKFSRLHSRIDAVFEKIDKQFSLLADQLRSVITNQAIIKTTAKQDNVSDRLKSIDMLLRGNGKKGVLERLYVLEQRNTSKEKFAWLIIGALCSGIIALIVTLVARVIQ